MLVVVIFMAGFAQVGETHFALVRGYTYKRYYLRYFFLCWLVAVVNYKTKLQKFTTYS